MPDPADPSPWFLSRHERAWTEGNLVRPLVDGAAYFRRLHDVLEATRAGDLVLFTDWEGDADERLTDEPGSEVVEVLARACERGVGVHGLVWRSHLDQAGFFAKENRHLGEQLDRRGVEVVLDMRVRAGGSHHQKLVVVRHRDEPERDVAFVGGIDLARSRRDDSRHGGDPQPEEMPEEYGDRPPWHDVQLEIRGPAVHDVETTFRERWDDPAPLSLAPWRRAADKLRRLDTSPDPLPPQQPPPPPAGDVPVQLLRTYPNLRLGRDYPFAPGGERTVARGYGTALRRTRRLAYVEDQYFWGHDVARVFAEQLRAEPELRLVVVIPLVPDLDGANRRVQLLGRRRAIGRLLEAAPGRVAAYGLENDAGVPIYVHAKVCVLDDTWASVGSDNFSRRSWTHDSELTAAVVAPSFARDLRLTLMAEHLGRLDAVEDRGLASAMGDCVDPHEMYDVLAASAARLDAWHEGGRVGERPPGRLRRLPLPDIPAPHRAWAKAALKVVHDPDGRPRELRGTSRY